MTAIEPSPSITLTPGGPAGGLAASSSDQREATALYGADRQGETKRDGVPFVTSLPLRLDVKIPLLDFRLKDLTHLAVGQILQTDWSVAEDLPVSVGDIKLLWAEFAVADQQLTVRVTRIA